MRRLLIVSPSFPPKNTADLHRVRLSLPFYRRFRWDPTVLCVTPECCEGLEDHELGEGIPSSIQVVRATVWDERICRRLGFGQLGYRSLMPLYHAGGTILLQEKFDLVFFSTTVFLTFLLGPLWKRRFGCSVVYDFQDPWYNETLPYSRYNVPGKWWKYHLDRILARFLEPIALRAADHIVSVSDGYARDLSRRYPFLNPSMFTVLPFPAPAEDYRFVHKRGIGRLVLPDGAALNWVSVGRAGRSGMDPVLNALFDVLSQLRAAEPKFTSRLRLHFVGTNYAPAGRSYKLVEPLAKAHGVAELVDERPERVPYFDALALYAASDAVLLIGSVNADYAASKLLGCVLSCRPVLALLNNRSGLARMARQFSNVFVAAFDESPEEPAFREQIARGIDWLRNPRFDPAAIDAEVEPWSAEAQTRRLCAIFDAVITHSQASPRTLAEEAPGREPSI